MRGQQVVNSPPLSSARSSKTFKVRRNTRRVPDPLSDVERGMTISPLHVSFTHVARHARRSASYQWGNVLPNLRCPVVRRVESRHSDWCIVQSFSLLFPSWHASSLSAPVAPTRRLSSASSSRPCSTKRCAPTFDAHC